MPRFPRTTRRSILVALAIFGLTAGGALAVPAGGVPKQIVFPVLGSVTYTNDYGDARPQGGHEGNDIMGPRGAPVLAAEDGKIKFHTTSARAGCMLYLYGASGTTYLYIHLNNDVKGDDNRGKCVPGVAYWPGLKDGQKVHAGEPIGYLGDSGDAEGGAPHLHFEIHPNGNGPTNPFRHLNRATRLLFAAPRGIAVTLSLTGSVVDVNADSLTMRVQELTVFPINLKLSKLSRPLTVAISESTLVDGGTALPGSGSTLGVSLAGRTVLVLTEPAAATLESQAAKDGAFAAARVVVK